MHVELEEVEGREQHLREIEPIEIEYAVYACMQIRITVPNQVVRNC